jgi:hypothetical protein
VVTEAKKVRLAQTKQQDGQDYAYALYAGTMCISIGMTIMLLLILRVICFVNTSRLSCLPSQRVQDL